MLPVLLFLIIVAVITAFLLALDKSWKKKLDNIRNAKTLAQEKTNPPKPESLASRYERLNDTNKK